MNYETHILIHGRIETITLILRTGKPLPIELVKEMKAVSDQKNRKYFDDHRD